MVKMFSDIEENLFNITFCVLFFSALKKLDDLNKSLAEYCAQKLPNGFKAEVGRPCCAFFTGKLGLWSETVQTFWFLTFRPCSDACFFPVFKHMFS